MKLPEFSNKILSGLSAEHRKLLGHLSPVVLPLKKQLEAANQPIGNVYFPETGMASVVGNGGTPSAIEVGMIGPEGMTGLAVVMGQDRSPYETYIQMAGTGHSVTSMVLRTAMSKSYSLHQVFLKSGHDFVIQTTATVFANATGTLAERLARWLLLAHDRIDGDDVHLTHNFLSMMLGVRRAGVTLAITDLEHRTLVQRAGRGTIKIVDRRGLMKFCKAIYSEPAKKRRRSAI